MPPGRLDPTEKITTGVDLMSDTNSPDQSAGLDALDADL